MKIAPLLAQFFYSSKKLDIPGIGSFYLDGDLVAIDEKKPELIQGVTFKYDRSIRQSPELISYISQHTGKIKALASADLESFWELAIQFLQIGKPFQIEGIGSLTKLQSGGYSFSPGLPNLDKIEPEKHLEEKNNEQVVDYKSILYIKKIGQGSWKRPLAIFLFVAGLSAAIWGGYYMSRHRENKSVVKELVNPPNELISSYQDSTAVSDISDSLTKFGSDKKTDSHSYKFVVETAVKKRALSRYDFLSRNGIAVKMETHDSLSFDLYFSLVCLPKDTSGIKDSLARFYSPLGKHAYIKF